MGLFDRFRKRNDEPAVTPPSQSSLPSICYGIAYLVLPHYAYKDCAKLASMFTDTPTSAGPFFYLMGCQVQKTEPIHENASRFQAHHGELDGTHEYFVLEYPTPPPVDLSGTDPTQLPPGRMPVLAPYFSAIVRHRDTKVVSYYTLGQAPFGGGTTLRSVTPEGTNCNHGPGPEPRLDAFLARLRSAG
jgi:hypothetical protein